MNAEMLLDVVMALGNCGDFLRWRRRLCLGQWTIDDCGAFRDADSMTRGFGTVLSGDDYGEAAQYAIRCWTSSGSLLELAEALVVELRGMTEDEASEPNPYRWIAPPFDSRAWAHVGQLFKDAWGILCDRSSDRKNYSDRVRGRLLLCPACFARVTAALSSSFDHPAQKTDAIRLLRQVGWKETDPPPRIFSTVEGPHSWCRRRP